MVVVLGAGGGFEAMHQNSKCTKRHKRSHISKLTERQAHPEKAKLCSKDSCKIISVLRF